VGKSKHNKTLLRCKESKDRKKKAETCCLSFDSLHLNKVLLCFDLPTLYQSDIVIAHNGDEPPKH